MLRKWRKKVGRKHDFEMIDLLVLFFYVLIKKLLTFCASFHNLALFPTPPLFFFCCPQKSS